MKTHARHFHALDLLRGLAAVSVVLLHYTEHSALRLPVPDAWVAVDLFFVLSGFVLMHSYSERIGNGMGLSAFIRVRLIRLGPMYILGCTVGILSIWALPNGTAGFDLSRPVLLQAGAFGLLGVPFFNHIVWPFGTGHLTGPIFPLEVPAWSLFFEGFVNGVFFLWLVFARRVPALFIAAVFYAAFTLLTIHDHTFNPGWGTQHFWLGFSRVIAEFFMGAALYQVGAHHWAPRPLAAFLSSAVFFALMLSANNWIGFFDATVMAPLAIAFSSSLLFDKSLRALGRFAGQMSYPLYLVHYPIYRIVFGLRMLTLLGPRLQMLLIFLIALVSAWGCTFLDAMVRDRLENRW